MSGILQESHQAKEQSGRLWKMEDRYVSCEIVASSYDKETIPI